MLRSRKRSRGGGNSGANSPWYTQGKVDNTDPSLWLDFVNNRYAVNNADVPLNTISTFTRGTIGTYYGSDGLIKTAAIDTPRFDYDPVTKAAKGILIEGQATNFIKQSQYLSSPWISFNAPTVTQNASTSPDGTVNSSTIAYTTNNSGLYQSSGGVLTIGSTYTQSLYIKFISGTSTRMKFGNDASGFKGTIMVNPMTMTITSVASAVTRSSISEVGNGWYRVSWSWVATDTGCVSVIYNDINNPLTVAVWGVQLEQGMPSSYIPTTTSAVTRSADNLTLPTAAWYSVVANTSYISHSVPYLDPVSDQYLYSLDNGSTQNIYTQWYNPTQLNTNVTAATSTVYNPSAVTLAIGAQHKNAVASKLNDFIGAYDGTLQATSVSGAMPTGITTLVVGAKFDNLNSINGWIKEFRHYPVRGLNASLQSLTAP